MVKQLERDASLVRRSAAPPSAPDTAWAFFNGRHVPISEAKVSVMTHAFNYGTGVFEGIRAYWNAAHEELYVLHARDHYERMLRSCRVMRIDLPHGVDELVEITVEMLRRCGYREDAYVRPIAYKATPGIGVRLNDLDDAFTVFAVPFGTYLDIDRGNRCTVSSWRRTDDNAIPARSKITGAYVNAALAKTEALENGFDEAIVLNPDGHVAEGSAENLFMLRDGKLVTPPATDNILEGIVRRSLMGMARDELGLETVERSIDRTELYLADEVFLCGTGVQIAPVVEIDRRPVGDGKVGTVTRKLGEIYFAAVRGDNPKYRRWLTPVYGKGRVSR